MSISRWCSGVCISAAEWQNSLLGATQVAAFLNSACWQTRRRIRIDNMNSPGRFQTRPRPWEVGADHLRAVAEHVDRCGGRGRAGCAGHGSEEDKGGESNEKGKSDSRLPPETLSSKSEAGARSKRGGYVGFRRSRRVKKPASRAGRARNRRGVDRERASDGLRTLLARTEEVGQSWKARGCACLESGKGRSVVRKCLM